uniref:Alpha-1,3-mannosyl-glycoprotein 2-beta-N-acetylglucosaminyltransferase n=1 Tax=Globodera pallida TaxID=36090 RepID=A0A183CAR5_GLOPA
MHYSLRQLNKDGLNLDVQNRAADFLEQRLDQLEDLLRNEQRELGELSRRIDAKASKYQRSQRRPLVQKIAWQHPIPVLVFVCNRLEAARVHLQKLIRYRRHQKELFPIIVSQDCDNKALQEMIQREFGSEVQHVKHISSESARLKPPPEHRQFSTYYKIARHYKLGLTHVFDNVNFTSVIITEDDLDVAPDFFDFFLATRPLLEVDRSLFCVSAWNDNGKKGLVDLSFGPSLLYRSDFFPGLGWMITRHFWEELRPKWPRAFWDDFLREPEQRKNRSCIRPEISRTAMTEFGRIGASKGLFFNRHLKRIFLNQITVNFTRMDLGSLQQQRYDDKFLGRVYSAPEVGIMADSKAGVPRTAYRGIVTCFLNGTRLFIAPPKKWNGYNRKWEAPRSILDGMDT